MDIINLKINDSSIENICQTLCKLRDQYPNAIVKSAYNNDRSDNITKIKIVNSTYGTSITLCNE